MDQKKFNGERLRNARIYNGISLTDLADQAEISKQSISLYENGKNAPDFTKVRTLSQILGFPMEYFFQEDHIKTYTETTYFRSQATATKKGRAAQSVKLEFVAQMYEVLWNYIDFPVYNDPKVEFEGYDDPLDCETQEAIDEMEAAAQKVGECWGLSDKPIKDLQYVLEQNGILVTGFPTDADKIDAFSQRTIVDNADVFLIAVALGKQFSECRIRFDMAHELGHIVMHPWSEDIESLSKDEFKARERQANMFASAFLLPRESFLRDVLQYPTDLNYYRHLKKKWKVSIQAMIVRAKQLDAISPSQYQYMFRQLSKNGWRISEPDDVPGELNESIFQGAIDLLFDNHILSAKTLMADFRRHGISLYPDMIEKLLHLKKGTLDYEDKVIPLVRIKNANDTE